MGLKQKGYRKKLRNSNSKVRKPITYISAEGNNRTETQYFRDLCRDKSRIVRFTPGNYTDPVNMVDALKKQLEEEDYNPDLGDKAYCVFDMDIDSKKDKEVEKAEKNARGTGIELIASAPCFEVWLLGHYTYSTKKYRSNDEVITDLRKHLGGYRKNDQEIYLKTYSRLETALENAMKLEKYCTDNGYIRHTVDYSPCTEIYRIVKELVRNI